MAKSVFLWNVRALGATPLGYQNTNLLVYVLGFPLLNAGLLLMGLWPVRSEPNKSRTGRWARRIWGGVAALLVVPMVTGGLSRWGWSLRGLYWYCTDFCIHAANLTGVPYDAFNFLLFTVSFPGSAVVLAVWAGSRFVRDGLR